VNEAALRTYGYTRVEFLRLGPQDLRLPLDRAALEACLAASGEGPVALGPARLVCRDGTLLDVCESTNKQRSLEDYLRRAALTGRDPRGGAMALLFATDMAGLAK
jgi:PAS domain-containing protein